VLFSLKNCKNHRKLGALLPDPLTSAAGGLASRPSHQSSYIGNYFLCICPQRTSTDSFGIS